MGKEEAGVQSPVQKRCSGSSWDEISSIALNDSGSVVAIYIQRVRGRCVHRPIPPSASPYPVPSLRSSLLQLVNRSFPQAAIHAVLSQPSSLSSSRVALAPSHLHSQMSLGYSYSKPLRGALPDHLMTPACLPACLHACLPQSLHWCNLQETCDPPVMHAGGYLLPCA